MIIKLTDEFSSKKQEHVENARRIFLEYGTVAAADHLAHTLFKDRTYGRHSAYLHLLTVASPFKDKETKAAALMHDLLEDIEGWTENDLREIGFSERTISAVTTLTKKPDEPYYNAMDRISRNEDTISIKLADLNMNIDSSYLAKMPNKDSIEHVQKYWLAIRYLESVRDGETRPASFGRWVKKNMQDFAKNPEDVSIIRDLVKRHYKKGYEGQSSEPVPTP